MSSGAPAPSFLLEQVVLELHDAVIGAHGGAVGLRDAALLASALARPVNHALYAPDASLHDLAAQTAFGIARSHPFLDGNKRTAWAGCVLFLAVNGVVVPPDPPGAADMVVALATGALDAAGFARWLRDVAG